MKAQTEIEKIVKKICIEAQNNKFITPIVFRQSIALYELFMQLVEGLVPEKKSWRKEPSINGLTWNSGYNDAIDQFKANLERLKK